MNRKQRFFNKFTIRFCGIIVFVTICGHVLLIAASYSYSTEVQSLTKEIQAIQASIDALEMKKQELVSFERLSEVATEQGYTYRSDAVASYTATSSGNE